ncbi:AbrB family transcriptional regulator [Terrihabitans rhizophilus]|uniref:AbrB family transcriptional regulator n=1 Tax=Terrihabitans rhizophilus TaxID=3092662 RepID=A0ABU4RIW3_9HYPH|nr:AbrB family transcriptional regulator [Terrihabitans sp. PJ23]MDX6804779.1 AbrB family transcriptional regulator [Terrihabitans sp. PJ23]
MKNGRELEIGTAPPAHLAAAPIEDEEVDDALAGGAGHSSPRSGAPQERFNALPVPVTAGTGVLIAALGGYLATTTGIPLPWLLGALFTTAAIALLGVTFRIPTWIRQAGQVVAGFAVGVLFTPEVGYRVLQLGWLMVLGGLGSILASVAISVLMARITGCDRKSAFFAMIPGGLAEMAGLAHQFGANITAVSVSQSLRIVILVVTVPPALTMLVGSTGGHAAHPPALGAPWLAGGLIVAALLSILLVRLRVFNAFLIGGLAAGIAMGLSMPAPVSAPDYARAFAQVAIGVALGAKFQWITLRAMGLRFLPATVLCTLLLLLANVGLAWMMSGHVPYATAVLATSPGGVAEMSLTAEALNLIAPLVTAWHLVRIVLVAVLTAPLFRLYSRVA